MLTTFNYDHYFQYKEMTTMLRMLSEGYSDLMQLESLYTTEKNHEVWAVTLTNQKTGAPLSKPAFYIDGNTHAGEVTGSMAALHTIDVLVTNYQENPEIKKLLDTCTIYVIPRISPDGAEVYLSTPYSLRSVDRNYYEDKGDFVNEDMDKDGVIRMMRIPDAYGAWKKSEQNPEIMVKRQPDEQEGEFYTIVTEGTTRNYDGLQIKKNPTIWGLDFNRNYPFGWSPEARQPGAGAYPLSNPENKAVVDFVLSHPNISAVATLHTSGGVLLYPPGTKAEAKAESQDMDIYRRLGKMGTECMGYEAINIFDSFIESQEFFDSGAFDDWCYQSQGIYAFTVELWDLMARVGNPIDWRNRKKETEESQVDDYMKAYQWCQENAPEAIQPWTTYEHPVFKTVEIGGLNYKFTHQNPPVSLLLQEVEKTTKFMLRYAKILPQLVIDEVVQTWLSDEIVKIEAVISNKGFLPTYVSHEAKNLKTDKPVKVSLQCEGELLQGEAITEIGDLAGFGCTQTQYCYFGGIDTENSEPIHKKVSWIVKADKGTPFKVLAFQEKSGKAQKEGNLI